MQWFQAGIAAAELMAVGAPDWMGWAILITATACACLAYRPPPPLIGWHANMSGVEFERSCLLALRQAGWKATMTATSGDQGVDIVAQKKGLRVAIQCKRHSRPVGNKAVQEALAGREFVRATYGVVVSNAPYTTAARALARQTGIRLLHFSDLHQFDAIFRST